MQNDCDFENNLFSFEFFISFYIITLFEILYVSVLSAE